jgi:hypothetical protein
MMGANSAAETAYLSGSPEFTPILFVLVLRDLLFSV